MINHIVDTIDSTFTACILVISIFIKHFIDVIDLIVNILLSVLLSIVRLGIWYFVKFIHCFIKIHLLVWLCLVSIILSIAIRYFPLALFHLVGLRQFLHCMLLIRRYKGLIWMIRVEFLIIWREYCLLFQFVSIALRGIDISTVWMQLRRTHGIHFLMEIIFGRCLKCHILLRCKLITAWNMILILFVVTYAISQLLRLAFRFITKSLRAFSGMLLILHTLTEQWRGSLVSWMMHCWLWIGPSLKGWDVQI